MLSPLTSINTSSNVIVAPVSAFNNSTLRVSPSTTRCCLPPLWITAYIMYSKQARVVVPIKEYIELKTYATGGISKGEDFKGYSKNNKPFYRNNNEQDALII